MSTFFANSAELVTFTFSYVIATSELVYACVALVVIILSCYKQPSFEHSYSIKLFYALSFVGYFLIVTSSLVYFIDTQPMIPWQGNHVVQLYLLYYGYIIVDVAFALLLIFIRVIEKNLMLPLQNRYYKFWAFFQGIKLLVFTILHVCQSNEFDGRRLSWGAIFVNINKLPTCIGFWVIFSRFNKYVRDGTERNYSTALLVNKVNLRYGLFCLSYTFYVSFCLLNALCMIVDNAGGFNAGFTHIFVLALGSMPVLRFITMFVALLNFNPFIFHKINNQHIDLRITESLILNTTVQQPICSNSTSQFLKSETTGHYAYYEHSSKHDYIFMNANTFSEIVNKQLQRNRVAREFGNNNQLVVFNEIESKYPQVTKGTWKQMKVKLVTCVLFENRNDQKQLPLNRVACGFGNDNQLVVFNEIESKYPQVTKEPGKTNEG
eukprot:Pgem_evm1s20002